MARSLSEIYDLALKTRDEYLGHTEVRNGSKMSVIDAFTWTTSACIWAFENLMDVLKVDLAKDLRDRVNGTPSYLANALLKYQTGDELVISDDGTKFSYAHTDPSKRVVTKVSYSEIEEEGFHDKTLLLKIATGAPGQYTQIGYDELVKIRAYLSQLLFAGQHAMVVSRKGDVLVPNVTVYYDGAVPEAELMENIRKQLNAYICGLDFDGVVYAQKILDSIQKVDHVTDVQMNTEDSDRQGIFIAKYDDDNNPILNEAGGKLHKVGRHFVPNSGYLKESAGRGDEEGIPTWSSSITIVLEDRNAIQD